MQIITEWLDKHGDPQIEKEVEEQAIEMKTIEQWLNELPDGYRERALENVDKDKLNYPTESMRSALVTFTWSSSKEGYYFWNAVWNFYRKPLLPPLPKEEKQTEEATRQDEVIRIEPEMLPEGPPWTGPSLIIVSILSVVASIIVLL